ncbi:hypothetical protein DEMA109039_17230 [Deinococcus marmoris]
MTFNEGQQNMRGVFRMTLYRDDLKEDPFYRVLKILAAGAFFGWILWLVQFDGSIVKRTVFRLTHKVYIWEKTEGLYPNNEVATRVKEHARAEQEARACAEAFAIGGDHRTIQGRVATCRVFPYEAQFKALSQGKEACVLAVAVNTRTGFGGYAMTVNADPTGFCSR